MHVLGMYSHKQMFADFNMYAILLMHCGIYVYYMENKLFLKQTKLSMKKFEFMHIFSQE